MSLIGDVYAGERNIIVGSPFNGHECVKARLHIRETVNSFISTGSTRLKPCILEHECLAESGKNREGNKPEQEKMLQGIPCESECRRSIQLADRVQRFHSSVLKGIMNIFGQTIGC